MINYYKNSIAAQRTSEKFKERFKGKISLIDKEGYIGVVARSSVPIEKRFPCPRSAHKLRFECSEEYYDEVRTKPNAIATRKSSVQQPQKSTKKQHSVDLFLEIERSRRARSIPTSPVKLPSLYESPYNFVNYKDLEIAEWAYIGRLKDRKGGIAGGGIVVTKSKDNKVKKREVIILKKPSNEWMKYPCFYPPQRHVQQYSKAFIS